MVIDGVCMEAMPHGMNKEQKRRDLYIKSNVLCSIKEEIPQQFPTTQPCSCFTVRF
jgi:hypothetical protein